MRPAVEARRPRSKTDLRDDDAGWRAARGSQHRPSGRCLSDPALSPAVHPPLQEHPHTHGRGHRIPPRRRPARLTDPPRSHHGTAARRHPAGRSGRPAESMKTQAHGFARAGLACLVHDHRYTGYSCGPPALRPLAAVPRPVTRHHPPDPARRRTHRAVVHQHRRRQLPVHDRHRHPRQCRHRGGPPVSDEGGLGFVENMIRDLPGFENAITISTLEHLFEREARAAVGSTGRRPAGGILQVANALSLPYSRVTVLTAPPRRRCVDSTGQHEPCGTVGEPPGSARCRTV
jgi:hypothetical protein